MNTHAPVWSSVWARCNIALNNRPIVGITPEPISSTCHHSELSGLCSDSLNALLLRHRIDVNPGSLDSATCRGDSPRLCCQIYFFLTITIYLYKLMPMNEQLNTAFAALADPTRRAILARLASGEATVMELAEPFKMTQPAISQHLKVLEDAGLVVGRVDGTKRPRRLVKAGIEAMDQWLAMLRKALEKNYDRLDEVLAGMEQPKISRGGKR